uniref:MULE transposase domain-containing protein n=1 Tax=Lactuca sativa TaxID=4236 RepID=A0A9R1XJ35_LACSA|nr:hypothetical protein LSAT_V11C400223780 [Lactuca sativa]
MFWTKPLFWKFMGLGECMNRLGESKEIFLRMKIDSTSCSYNSASQEQDLTGGFPEQQQQSEDSHTVQQLLRVVVGGEIVPEVRLLGPKGSQHPRTARHGISFSTPVELFQEKPLFPLSTKILVDDCIHLNQSSFPRLFINNLFATHMKSNIEGVTYDETSQENANKDVTEVESPKDDEDDNVLDVKGQPRWIGSHFTREVLENEKLNVRMLKEEVKNKFGIEVSMRQCRRAKQHAVSLVEGMCSGHLLCAVGRDGNNHIYPIDWVVVAVENMDNWKWFLENLKEDLHLESGFGKTLMSDQHKELFPDIEHRQCVRHVLSNFKKKYPDAHYEKLFLKSSKASTEPLFNATMKKVQMLIPAAYVHLMGRNPKSSSRAFFQEGRGSDVVENDLSESFTNILLDARKKPPSSL